MLNLVNVVKFEYILL